VTRNDVMEANEKWSTHQRVDIMIFVIGRELVNHFSHHPTSSYFARLPCIDRIVADIYICNCGSVDL
jgi:hypothetical protein